MKHAFSLVLQHPFALLLDPFVRKEEGNLLLLATSSSTSESLAQIRLVETVHHHLRFIISDNKKGGLMMIIITKKRGSSQKGLKQKKSLVQHACLMTLVILISQHLRFKQKLIYFQTCKFYSTR